MNGAPPKWKRLKAPLRGAKKKGKKVLRIMKGDKSRKEKKKEPEGRRELAVASEASSRQVDVFEQDDLQSDGAPPSPPNNAIRLALLLMDPKSRRFEFLQCDLDRDKASVRDILSFIKESALDEVFHQIEFTGVASCSGTEMILSLPMKQYVTSSEVLVAIPSGTNIRLCIDMARPILSDEKVIAVLESQNFQCPFPTNRVLEKEGLNLQRPPPSNCILETESVKPLNLTTSEEDKQIESTVVPTAKRGAISLLLFVFIPFLFVVLYIHFATVYSPSLALSDW